MSTAASRPPRGVLLHRPTDSRFSQVLQRLEGVGPARQALRSATMASPPARADLEAALALAKPVRSMLGDDNVLFTLAEALVEQAVKEEAESKWREVAAGLTWGGQQQPGGTAAEDGPEAVQAVQGSAVGTACQQASSSAALCGTNGLVTSSQAAADSSQAASASPPPSESLSAAGLSTLELEMECVVCLFRPKQTCCIPCGHVCMVSMVGVAVRKA